MAGSVKGIVLGYKADRYTELFDDNSSVYSLGLNYDANRHTGLFDDNSSVSALSISVEYSAARSQIISTKYVRVVEIEP